LTSGGHSGSAGRRRPQRDVPDLLETGRGAPLYVGNPRPEEHGVETIKIADAFGNLVPVFEGRTITAEARSSLGFDALEKELVTVPAPELWREDWPEFVVLTHVLRFLRSCTRKPSREEEGLFTDMKPLREGYRPLELLDLSGLDKERAEAAVKALKDREVLMYRTFGGEFWYVSTVYQGIGPEGEKFTAHELQSNWALPQTVLAGLVGPPAPPVGQGGANEVALIDEEKERLDDLNAILQVLHRHASADHVSTKGEKPPAGWLQFQPETAVMDLLAAETGQPKRRVADQFLHLTLIEVAESIPMGPHPTGGARQGRCA
jgi:hypothetical protein